MPPKRRTIRISNESSDDDDPVIVQLDLPGQTTPPTKLQATTSGQNSDFDALTDALETLSVRDTADQTLYETRDGLTAHWFEAVHLNSPQTPSRAVVRRGRTRKPARAYVVFVGTVPGVYFSWNECEDQVSGVSANIYRGYTSRQAARAAYAYAVAQGLTRSTTDDNNANQYRIEWIAPRIWDHTDANPISEGVTEVRWYVVYVGLKPGVYATSLDAQLQTLGIPHQAHETYTTFTLARNEYFAAVAKNKVGTAVCVTP